MWRVRVTHAASESHGSGVVTLCQGRSAEIPAGEPEGGHEESHYFGELERRGPRKDAEGCGAEHGAETLWRAVVVET